MDNEMTNEVSKKGQIKKKIINLIELISRRS